MDAASLSARSSGALAFARSRTDLFDCRYVEDCIRANRVLPNILEYRVNKTSRFAPYDPLHLLRGRLSWSEVALDPEAEAEMGGGDSGGEVCSDFDEEDNTVAGRRNGDAHRLKTGRMPYTRKHQVRGGCSHSSY